MVKKSAITSIIMSVSVRIANYYMPAYNVLVRPVYKDVVFCNGSRCLGREHFVIGIKARAIVMGCLVYICLILF
jgi:hypothetical protein